ncbi:methyl-accepting chemotaxis protein [Scandinavium sp.]|uniref:methyl-accepting chemotaxis protein n=1 Tax=Scandinavium sp. TaxID=2830653 RepID=UPI0028A0DCBE|nr:methyl-accepting chemotaxis protein [Scandinavium sp.]
MLNRIKIVTVLLFVFGVFVALQITSYGVGFHALNTDRENSSTLNAINQQHSYLSDTLVSLLQTRSTIGRAGIRYMMDQANIGSGDTIQTLMTSANETLKQARDRWKNYEAQGNPGDVDESARSELKRQFNLYCNALEELIGFIKVGDMVKANAQPTQSFQDNFDREYVNYLHLNEKAHLNAVENGNRVYNTMLWTSAVALLLIALIIFAAWNGIRRVLITPLSKISAGIYHIADGDLMHSIEVSGTNEMGQLADHLRHMQSSLIRTVGNVRASADTINEAAKGIAFGNSELASRTEQQASSLEQTAASMEELTSTVKQNAENAQKANQLALNASSTAQRGGKVVDNVVTTMNEIASSSRKIADITSVIDGIAFQTNILALNAAVEAARAGEQGRGFSVVAGEVRNLAQRSAQAAKEIKILIDDSVSKVNVGSTLAESAGETMNEVVNATTHVTDLMSEIASASKEQSRGIEQVGLAVVEMDKVTMQNSSLVQQSSTDIHALEGQADVLSRTVAIFRIKDEKKAGNHPTIESKANATALPLTPREAAKEETSDDWEAF